MKAAPLSADTSSKSKQTKKRAVTPGGKHSEKRVNSFLQTNDKRCIGIEFYVYYIRQKLIP